jgi:hypothetical protein
MNGRKHNFTHFFSALGIAFSTLAVGATVACDAMDGTDERVYSGGSVELSVGEVSSISGGDEGDTNGGEGCTLTQGYWKNHSDYAENASQHKAWPISEDTQLCGQSWYDILHTAGKGDAWYVVAHQYIAASLNVASGAAVTAEVTAALAAAEGFLADCKISKAEKADAIASKDVLDAFNNGEIGPGHCDDTPTPETTGGETTGGDTGGDTTGGETGTDCIVDCGTTTGSTTDPIPG